MAQNGSQELLLAKILEIFPAQKAARNLILNEEEKDLLGIFCQMRVNYYETIMLKEKKAELLKIIAWFEMKKIEIVYKEERNGIKNEENCERNKLYSQFKQIKAKFKQLTKKMEEDKSKKRINENELIKRFLFETVFFNEEQNGRDLIVKEQLENFEILLCFFQFTQFVDLFNEFESLSKLNVQLNEVERKEVEIRANIESAQAKKIQKILANFEIDLNKIKENFAKNRKERENFKLKNKQEREDLKLKEKQQRDLIWQERQEFLAQIEEIEKKETERRKKDVEKMEMARNCFEQEYKFRDCIETEEMKDRDVIEAERRIIANYIKGKEIRAKNIYAQNLQNDVLNSERTKKNIWDFEQNKLREEENQVVSAIEDNMDNIKEEMDKIKSNSFFNCRRKASYSLLQADLKFANRFAGLRREILKRAAFLNYWKREESFVWDK